MKVKLTISDFSNFQLACEATDIRIVEKKDFGTKVIAIVDYKHASQLYEAGLMQKGITAPVIEKSEKLDSKNTPNTDAKGELKKR
jgi:hypothetical protein